MVLLSRRAAFLTILSSFLLLSTIENGLRAEELAIAPRGTFSVVVIPDTQYYEGRDTKREPDSQESVTNPTFETWTNWIAANVDRQRIVCVSHVGDIVDKNNRQQWAVARRCMDALHGKMPYGISVGNHDMTNTGDSSLFQEMFPRSRFEAFSWYGGCFTSPNRDVGISGNNANNVQLFDVADLKFVAVHLECNAPDDVLDWADSVLQKHSDRRAVVTTHMGLGPLDRPTQPSDYFDAPKGRMRWTKRHGKRGNTPQQMWDECFCKHRNLFMICCGDQSRTQALRQSSAGDRGNIVHELLSDYGTLGLRVMRFVPAKNVIEVRTWDPIRGKLCESTKIVSDRDQHQFTLKYRMSANQGSLRE